MRGRRGLALLVCAGAYLPGSAWALLQSCTVAATAVNFGTYDPLAATPGTATGTVTLTCTVTLVGLLESWTIALSTGSSNIYSARSLRNGASALSYNLYTSAAHSSVWGDGSGSTSAVNGSAFLSVGANTYPYTVYGQIPAGQDAAAGSYTDTIVVTVSY